MNADVGLKLNDGNVNNTIFISYFQLINYSRLIIEKIFNCYRTDHLFFM